jgi:hypothetical protein
MKLKHRLYCGLPCNHISLTKMKAKIPNCYGSVNQGLLKLWGFESKRRLQAMRSGKMKSYTMADVFSR